MDFVGSTRTIVLRLSLGNSPQMLVVVGLGLDKGQNNFVGKGKTTWGGEILVWVGSQCEKRSTNTKEAPRERGSGTQGG